METATNGAPVAPGRIKKPRSRCKLPTVLAALVGVVLVAGLCVWLLQRSSTSAAIDGGRYQAVFFTNGQVYFGKLRQVNAEYFKLSDVFYIQAEEAKADGNNPQQTSTDQTNISLIKLGSEVHGPDDEMIISRDQVLFFENLKNEGKVAESITKYNAEKE